MLVVSDTIKTAYNKYTTQRKSYIRIGEDSFFVQNLDVSADCYNEGNVIGNAIAKIAKFNIETEYINNLDEFELFDGIWTGNQYEYISLGTFKLFDEEGVDDFFSTVTAYDKLVLFNKEYEPAQTQYPTTLYELLKNICSQAGIELQNTSIPNGEQIIEDNLFVENETLKNILNAICQINGYFGIVSNDKLKLLLKGSEVINLDKYQISSPEYKRTTWKINQVILGMTNVEGEYVKYPDDTEIEGSIHKLVINDNPFVYTQELRQKYIKNLYDQVNGFGYIAFSTKWEGLSYVELGDLVTIEGKESVVLRYNLKSPKGLESTLEAPSIIDSVVKYVDNSNSIANSLKRTEFSINKKKQEINAIVTKLDDMDGTINGVQQTISSQSLQIDVLTTKTDKIDEEGNATSFQTTNGYKFDNGGLHMSNSEDNFNATYTNQGTYYKDGDDILQQTTKDGTKTKDIELYGVFKYGKETIDDDPMFIAQMYTNDSGEVGFGHFYNRGDE